MRLLVCGDRGWEDADFILRILRRLSPTVVIEGEARGADKLAARAAEVLGVPVERYPANWGENSRAAGYVRNSQMLREGKPDLVVAFHDRIDLSKGTADMIRIAGQAGVQVRLYTHSSIYGVAADWLWRE